MKTTIKSLVILAASTLALSSCIEETMPESSTATSSQVGESSVALEGLLSGIPSQMAQGYLVYGDQVHETDLAYPQFMISQTELLGDMFPGGQNSGYDWFRSYNTCPAAGTMDKNSYPSYLSWYTLYMFVKSANNIISSVDLETANDDQKHIAGIAYAARAFDYYHLMLFWEPVENEYTDCSKVLKLTTPIVTEATTNEEAKNNPRATHEEMVKFILSDCEKALELIGDYTPEKLYPSASVVYGIMARTYMWDEDYANAAKYARLAVSTFGGTPVTKAQWLDKTTGFNTANQAWMWKIHYDAENMGNLCNFIGWISGEADWGYSTLTSPMIDKSLYDKIGDNDFRKYTFLDPDRTFYAYESVRGQSWLDEQVDYLSIKFRCGSGDYSQYATGGAVDVPVMRVEEFYLIDAEATALSEGLEAGKAKLNSFMQSYRDASYNCTATTVRDFQLEVLTQERIEFWGEGEAFATAKRLQPNVIQNYDGTNAPAEIYKFNCKGIKPNWNFVIPIDEIENNNAITDDLNNPNPTACINYPTAVGSWATKK